MMTMNYIQNRNVDEQFYEVNPKTNVLDYEDKIAIVMEMPGIKKESLNVRVVDGVLTVSADRPVLNGAIKLMDEIKPLRFLREFQLGPDLDQDQIHAEYLYGLLTIEIMKKAKQQPREIKIN
ncbi:MAG: hypothetical protein Kow00108_15830 [Calditrichia bacterium]